MHHNGKLYEQIVIIIKNQAQNYSDRTAAGATEIISQPEKPPLVTSAKEREPANPEVTFLELGNIVGASSQTTIEWKRSNGESMRLVGAMSAK